MAYYQGYQPRILPEFSGQNAYGGGQGVMEEYGGGTYNMGVESPYSPPNNGGSGNPGTANNMPRPTLPRFQPFQNNKGPAPLPSQGKPPQYGGINPGNMYDAIRNTQNPRIPQLPMPDEWQRGDTNNPPQFQRRDPFNQYGYAGQSPQLGRYVPPMMNDPRNLNSWQGGGGYAFNIPNSYGSGQWNQFNSRDRPFAQFGQSPNAPPAAQQQQVPPSYQSPFGRPDQARFENYLTYLQGFAPVVGNNPTQPGAPDQPGPVT